MLNDLFEVVFFLVFVKPPVDRGSRAAAAPTRGRGRKSVSDDGEREKKQHGVQFESEVQTRFITEIRRSE
jgi:hypothetical protein